MPPPPCTNIPQVALTHVSALTHHSDVCVNDPLGPAQLGQGLPVPPSHWPQELPWLQLSGTIHFPISPGPVSYWHPSILNIHPHTLALDPLPTPHFSALVDSSTCKRPQHLTALPLTFGSLHPPQRALAPASHLTSQDPSLEAPLLWAPDTLPRAFLPCWALHSSCPEFQGPTSASTPDFSLRPRFLYPTACLAPPFGC